MKNKQKKRHSKTEAVELSQKKKMTEDMLDLKKVQASNLRMLLYSFSSCMELAKSTPQSWVIPAR